MSRFKPDWFLSGMLIAIVLAALFPAPGSEGGFLHPELVNKIGIAVIFFLHGLLLSFGAMKNGILQWKSHLAIQSVTFIVFPLLGLLFIKTTGGLIDPGLETGFFFLCALPSTVSSSVAMTSAAHGNVPIAVFNAALSSLIGLALTPLWLSMVVQQTSQPVPLGDTVLNLCQWLLLPMIAGQFLHAYLGKWAMRHKRIVSKFDRLIILFLIYTSFCDSFTQHVWSNGSVHGMALTIISTAFLLFAVIGSMWSLCDKSGVPSDMRSAIVFCASKKSLATGLPMARLIFGHRPELVLILLPVMLYHPLQLFVCGPLAQYWARQGQDERRRIS